MDCDVLIEGTFTDGAEAILVIETKLVETEFSTCGFRKAGREGRGQEVCPDDVVVATDRSACAYVHAKRYAYWQRTDETGTLRPLPEAGCPFGGVRWQLWTNHTLGHAEADRRGAQHARFLICAPTANHALLRDGAVVEGFRELLVEPNTVAMLPLDDLIEQVSVVVGVEEAWARGLRERYGAI